MASDVANRRCPACESERTTMVDPGKVLALFAFRCLSCGRRWASTFDARVIDRADGDQTR